MSDTKHTPGPWYEYDMGWVGQTAIAYKRGNANFLVVAAMNKGPNASLIAAAPELLDALKRLMQCEADILIRRAFAEDFDAARLAIAKATGQ
jgi:hypothetical protein